MLDYSAKKKMRQLFSDDNDIVKGLGECDEYTEGVGEA